MRQEIESDTRPSRRRLTVPVVVFLLAGSAGTALATYATGCPVVIGPALAAGDPAASGGAPVAGKAADPGKSGAPTAAGKREPGGKTGEPLPAGSSEEFRKAVELFEAGRGDEAAKAFETIQSKDPKNAGAASYLGRIAYQRGDLDAAVRMFEEAVDLEPGRSDHHMRLADAYAGKAEHASVLRRPFLARSIRKELEKAVELDPANLDARQGLVQFYLIAPGIMGGSVEKATEQASEIAKRDAARGHMVRAQIYVHEKDFTKAEQEYVAAARVDPAQKGPRYALGYFYQGQSKFDEAFGVFEDLVKADPGELPAYYQIGRTGVLSGNRLDRAEECFRTYIEKAPPRHALRKEGAQGPRETRV